ncbi:hypothetical protein IPJ63_02945 [Candidatus Nomurabacteria bacterium]|nr:MAG: hypothetical protein IPJ63_02945 [Candidatus Nomurabacteria bacterium]
MVKRIDVTPFPKKKLERLNGTNNIDFVENDGWVGFLIQIEFEDGRILEERTSAPLNSETELTPAYYFTVGVQMLASIIGAEYSFVHHKKDFTKLGNLQEDYEN